MSGVLALATGALRGLSARRERKRAEQLEEEERAERGRLSALREAAAAIDLMNQPGVRVAGAGGAALPGAPGRSGAMPSLTPEQLETLRALGYIR